MLGTLLCRSPLLAAGSPDTLGTYCQVSQALHNSVKDGFSVWQADSTVERGR